MRIPRITRACVELVSALFILLAGCGNPSSTSLNFLSLKVTPTTVSVGGAVALQAIAHLSDGTTQDVTSGTLWTLSNPSLATVGSDVLTSKAPGTLTVQAAYVMVAAAGQSSSGSAPQTLSSSAQVTITAAGTTTTTPAITWSTPAPIQYGTALSSALLDAKANVPGSFAYTPAAGTVLKAGTQTLTAVFTPTNTTTYSEATATVQLTVNQASPVITWAPLAAITQGTALSSAQLDATANVPGTFSYSPSAGAVPAVGTQPLTATFTPTDSADYVPATAHNSLTVGAPQSAGTPTISWSTPAAISYGTALNSMQLNATSSVAGTFTYTPAAGTVLKAGTQTLSAVFTPADTSTYSAGKATVQLTVTKANPVISWPPPAAIQQGTAISAAQLNATANVPGAFSYSPGAGTVPPVGTEPLMATFTPSDATDYMAATAHNSLTVNAANTGKSTPLISWSAPAAISYGAPLSSTQLDAKANVAGTFTYTPATGTVLKSGTQTLSAVFTPSDTSTYSSATAKVQLTVTKVNPVISWPPATAIQQGTAISAIQLDATANVPGTFSYSPSAGTVPPVGTEPLTATFSPSDATDYMSVTAHNSLTVNASSTSTPAISWGAPAAISYGTALSSTQLNATANVAGTFAYTPAAGTVLKAGTQTLSAVFTPSDTKTYSSATATVQLTVSQATPAITWPALAAITQGTALGAAQLDATANVAGAFTYNPGAGNVPAAGTLQLTATFTPTDTTDYSSASAHNTIVVNSSTSAPTPPANPSLAGCGGPTINVNSSMSQSTLQSTISSAPSCAVIVFAAGTYGPITSPITIPCGVSLSGPTVPYSQTPNQTATINGSVGSNWGFLTTAGCSASQTIQYLNWNGGQPNGGGGFLGITSGTTNLVVQNNYLHGINCGQYCNSYTANLVNFGLGTDPQNGSGPVTSNVTVQWNIFGASGDCGSGAMTDTETENGGGFCNGVGMGNNLSNVTISNNIFLGMENSMKFYEGQGECNNCVIDYNDYSGFDRIGYETQANDGGSSPTLMYIDYNSFHSPLASREQNYDISAANGCNTPSGANPTNCVTHTDYNLVVADTPSPDVGFEIWGGNGTTASGNFFVGQYLYDLITWSMNGQFVFNNNTDWVSGNEAGTGTFTGNCDSGPFQGFWNVETGNFPSSYTVADAPYLPTCSGNVYNDAGTGTITSVAPSLSLSGSTVTIANTGISTPNGSNPGRDSNTTDWCTTDGSTPSPGGSNSTAYWQGAASTTSGTITLGAGTTTVKCVGMWGAPNQPYSYDSGYGYVPSAVVSATYTVGAGSVVKKPGANLRSSVSGTDTVVSTEAAGNGAATGAELAFVAIVPAQATVAIGSTTQLKAIATFSDGATKDVTQNFAWTSSDTRTIAATSSGLLSGLATGKATITGSYQGRQASAPAVSSIGEVNWSGPIVITEAGTYSGNWQSTDSKTPAVTVATAAPVVIENSHISSVAGLIKTTVAGADLTVRNSVGLAANPGVKGQANGIFLEASSPARLDVENNYVENAGGGVLVHGYSGNRDGQQTIVIRANRARNLNGLLSDGKGGYLPGVGSNHSISSFIELDKVQAVPGIDVGWNEVINYPGRSLVADNIAVKSSSGTPNQPLEIHDTYIQGAYPYTAAQADYQGGGIKTEGSPEDSTQQAPAFNSIHDNQVVGTVNYGIEFTAGHDNIAANNRVISSGMLANGTKLAAQQVGMANGDVNSGSANMYNNTMHDNLIGWACWTSSCSQSGYRQDQSFPASPGDYSTNSVLAAQPITPATEENEYQIWLNKTASAGIAVGPAF